MKFLSLEQALIIAAEVTGLPVETVARSARLDLLDSALATPDCEESSASRWQQTSGVDVSANVL